MKLMLLASFFSWWYSRGWRDVLTSLSSRTQGVAATFSVSQLLRTLFAPWRRIISYGGDAFADKVRAWFDNIFSRAVGFVVRLIVLFTALLVTIAVVIFTLIEMIVWPLLPLAVPVLIVVGLT